MITEHDLDELRSFIRYLNETEVRTKEWSEAKLEKYRKTLRFNMLPHIEKPQADRVAAAERHLAQVKKERFDDPLGEGPVAKSERKVMDQSFCENLHFAKMSFSRHLRIGEVPAPHYVNRLGVLLRRAKHNDLWEEIRLAWNRHFPWMESR